jgi:glycosyltransferase involved in cell wall biosynthesis
MHIAYIINQYPKVSHSFIRREILALEKAGTPVVRIAMRGWSEPLVDPVDVSECERTHFVLRHGLLPCFFALILMCLSHPIRLFRALFNLVALNSKSEASLLRHIVYLAEACSCVSVLRRENITHLHAHFGTNAAEVALQCATLYEIPFSFTVHGSEEFDKPRALGLPYKIKKAAFVVAISSFSRSQLYRHTGVYEWDKIKLIRCGVDLDFFKDSIKTVNLSNRLVCVGRLCEQKGQMLLLKALQILQKESIDFYMVFAGDGEMRSVLEEKITDLGLSDKVKITGWLSSSQVREEILDARALILPSFIEGLPVVIMEAMTLHRLVVSTHVAGIPELIESGVSGLLVAPGDVLQLVDVLKKTLLLDAQDLTSMTNHAYRQVRHFHDIDTEALKLLTLFNMYNQNADQNQLPSNLVNLPR